MSGVIQEQRPAYVVDEVRVSTEGGGLRMECGQCGAVELVLLEQTAFNNHVKLFLGWHPDGCAAT
jgi:hypothetical protein